VNVTVKQSKNNGSAFYFCRYQSKPYILLAVLRRSVERVSGPFSMTVNQGNTAMLKWWRQAVCDKKLDLGNPGFNRLRTHQAHAPFDRQSSTAIIVIKPRTF